MAIRVVRLGSDRLRNEGTRIGTVRRPPRGVPKSDYASRNWYDVWLPILSPSPETMKLGLAADSPAKWKVFERKYRSEMKKPDASRTIDLLAALSADSDFSVGCYCDSQEYCHRWILEKLLRERGATVVE